MIGLLTLAVIITMHLLPAHACIDSAPEQNDRNQKNRVLLISCAGLILVQQTAL